ncbi:hypothetical protein WBG78_22995 [Chryseolinea sp. T2]|uniref:hypothetical protein n=1 Tax=Chryseolinea sp. T2 TaxID=3129255 RepID=UPI0030776C15
MTRIRNIYRLAIGCLASIGLMLASCKDKNNHAIPEYNNIFGKWKVVDATYIPAENSKGQHVPDTIALAKNYLRYIYVFNSDSTFQRGKPEVKHENIEEAHGSFSVLNNKKLMRWYIKFSRNEEIDTADIEIVNMTNATIVLIEPMGGRNSMKHVLERVED